MTKVSWLVLALSALTTHVALAEPTAQPASPLTAAMAALDKNSDGKLERAEYVESRRPRFTRADADANGALSLAEFATTLGGATRDGGAQLFATVDADHSGGMSAVEFDSYQAAIFTQAMDVDKDGFLSAEEIQRMTQTARAAAPAAALDANGDGNVSLAEYLGFQSARFPALDADSDGGLSFSEFKASLTERGQRTARESFTGFDLNRNNKLAAREFVTFHDFVFKKVIDRNHDDLASGEEFAALMGGGR